MPEDAKSILVLIPFPVMSHLVSAVETAKLLTGGDDRLAVAILVMKLPMDTKISSYIKNSPHPRISFVELQENKSVSAEWVRAKDWSLRFLESQKGAARAAVAEIVESGKLAGFVVDMFCTPMIDVANELGAPAYIYFPSGSAYLGLLLHLQSLHDKNGVDLKEYEDSDKEVCIPTYVNAVPARVWPAPIFDDETGMLEFVRGYREASGILINTFLEFESHAINSLSADEKLPQVYAVGPIIQEGEEEEEEETDRKKEIIEWLDNQPDSSVVFLCFGTRGSFERNQVHEIAVALEHSGLQFLWSLRKPPPQGSLEFPVEYENLEEILPDGFLERCFGKGMVIGWAPQMAVLSHPAVGGFVSHCGWNSILESIWCGVPMAVWPLAAEQQLNAFQLVKELEMAVEIQMDYKKNSGVIIDADTIEKAMRQLMEPVNKIRVKVKELQKKSRVARVEGCSSYNFLSRLIHNIVDNVY